MAHASSPRLLALHALRLRGIATAADVAAYVHAGPALIEAELHELEGLGLVTPRRGRFAGWALTPEGRALGARLVVEEVEQHGLRPRIESAYDEFLALNGQLLSVCTQWQLRTEAGRTVPNDHVDADHDGAVIRALVSLDERSRPVLASLTEVLARFEGHGERLRYALDRVVAGEHDWFTKPMFPSYHSCWFELHEDLLATLGRERNPEGSP
ncbi:MAG: MarR family transcriptional regulator [Acidimicrobiia bacterium]